MRTTADVSIALAACLVATACSSAPPTADEPTPAPPPAAPEAPASTPSPESLQYLRRALSDFAADSMEGRAAGSRGHYRATTYLAHRAEQLGLQPAGDDGSWFQDVPIRTVTPYSTVEVAGERFDVGPDVIPIPPQEGMGNGTGSDLDGRAVVYGGRMLASDEITAQAGAGKVVVLGAGLGPGGPTYGIAPQVLEKFADAAAVLLATLDYAPPGLVEAFSAPSGTLAEATTGVEGPLLVFISDRLGERLIGGSFDTTAPGTEGAPLSGSIGTRSDDPEAPTRNVIAVLPGSDPDLRNEYVVVSAHSDHLAMGRPVADHDSLRAYLTVVRPRGAENPAREPTPDEAMRIAEIRGDNGNGAARPDSISNGADDDGSGSVGLLEIARRLGARDPAPRRSTLFVWHTAEEMGLLGAQHFTDHPTVPLDSIVAALNLDMIGRGGAADLPGGGPEYVQLIGSRRLSTQLGDLVEEVNAEQGHGFTFDYGYDADGHPDNYYCRSDHYMYARYGIPIVFFSTGGHMDYHQLTDEAQYIDYEKLSRVSALVGAVAGEVANLDTRPLLDGPVPDPTAPCQQ